MGMGKECEAVCACDKRFEGLTLDQLKEEFVQCEADLAIAVDKITNAVEDVKMYSEIRRSLIHEIHRKANQPK